MYNYENEKSSIFTEKGQVDFLKVRDNVRRLISLSGAVSMDKAMGSLTGSSWFIMALVDRMVELGELKEITKGMDVSGQDRIFVQG